MHDSVDLCVIGAGLAGLTATLTAARSGLRVVVVTGRVPGGRALADQTDGYSLNQGAHALYEGGDAARTWASLGIEVPGGRPSFPFYAEAEGALHRLPTDARSLLATTLLSWPSKIRLGTIFSRLPALARAAGPGTFADWLERSTADADVRRVLFAVARLSTFNADPGPLGAAAVLRQIQLGAQGVRYVDRGWTSIVEALTEACDAAGATRIAKRATRVEPADGRWLVACSDGQRIVADTVIVATSPTAFTRLTGEPVPPLVPVRAAALDLGLRRLPDPEMPFVLDLDTPRYGSAQSLAAALAPDGAAVLHVLAYLGPDDTVQRTELEAWVDTWQPGWRDQVAVARWRPGITVQHRAPRLDAPAVPVEVAPGLLRAGDWVGDGFLSDAAVASAVQAVHAARHQLGQRRAG